MSFTSRLSAVAALTRVAAVCVPLLASVAGASAQLSQPMMYETPCIVRLTWGAGGGPGQHPGPYYFARTLTNSPPGSSATWLPGGGYWGPFGFMIDDDVSALSTGTVVYYWVNNAGLGSSWSYQGSRTLQASMTPVTGVAATDDLCDRVRVTWTYTAQSNSYDILRDGFVIGTKSASSQGQCEYDDTGTSAGVAHNYTVRIAGTCNQISSAPEVGNRGKPPQPTLTVTPQCGAFDLSWTALGATSYRVETNDGGVWGTLVSQSGTTYTQTGPRGGGGAFWPVIVSQTYRVYAINACGESVASATVTKSLYQQAYTSDGSPLTPTPPLKGGTVNMSVNVVNPSPTVTYQWQRNGTNISNGSGTLGTVSGATTSSLSISNAQLAAAGAYRAVMTNTCGTANSSVADLVVRCGQADLGKAAGQTGPDGLLDNNDFIVFNALYAASDMRADLGNSAGTPGPDGQLDNGDFVAQIALYFSGCP